MFGICDSIVTMLCTRSSSAREISFDVNVQVRRAGIDHWISLERPELLPLKNFVFDGGLQNAEINGLALAEFTEVEFLQAIVKPTQARELGVEREAAVVGDFAIGTRESRARRPEEGERRDSL